MRGRRRVAVRSGRAGPPAPAPPPRRRRRRCRQPNALGTSAGVRWHGAAGRAGGAAPTTRSQTSPFCIGMGKAETTGHGASAVAGDGGTGDARAVRRRGRAARLAAQHTAARRRVRTGRASAVAGTLSARRADENQRAASTEQKRDRCARVGRSSGHGRAARRRQEGWAAAEGHALVGAHGRARAGAPAAGERGRQRAALRHGAAHGAGRAGTAALRHGPAARAARPAARRVTPPRAEPSRASTISRLHSIIGTIRLAGVHARPGVL